ncbi:MAG TPA: polysaccharide deacetylase family protein [Mycobacteriales bacterium]|nr:polysaccharide deacetylase family protein [Mycobacteriales bacterium]
MRRIATVVLAAATWGGIGAGAAAYGAVPTQSPSPAATPSASADGWPGSGSPANRCSGYVGLTFDDGPTQLTPQLLSILRFNDATATFFDVGANMQQYPGSVREEARLGEIGNHSYDHPYLDELSFTDIFNELLGTNQITQQLVGYAPDLFRPPYDRIDSDVTAAQYSLGMVTALWNIDSGDYDGISPAEILRNVWSARAGDVILFHDGLRSTLAALPLILAHFKSERLCTGVLVPSATPHFAWPTESFGNVVFYAQVAPIGTPAPTVASLNLTPQQESTGVGPDAAAGGD